MKNTDKTGKNTDPAKKNDTATGKTPSDQTKNVNDSSVPGNVPGDEQDKYNPPALKHTLTDQDLINHPELKEAGLKAGDEVELNDDIKKQMAESLAAGAKKVVATPDPNPEYRPETANLGNDEDGTPKISANDTLNKVGKKIILLFQEREGTNLAKLTGTDITRICEDQSIEIAFQYSNPKKLRGRMVIKTDGTFLELPTDINEEFNFGVDFEAMAEEARQQGKEFGEKELAAAKEEALLDEQETNRLSVKKLELIGSEITRMFEERGKTNLPGLTQTEILHACRNHANSIGMEAIFEDEEKTIGRFKLTEFSNEVFVPAKDKDPFIFGIDYEALAKQIEEAAKK